VVYSSNLRKCYIYKQFNWWHALATSRKSTAGQM